MGYSITTIPYVESLTLYRCVRRTALILRLCWAAFEFPDDGVGLLEFDGAKENIRCVNIVNFLSDMDVTTNEIISKIPIFANNNNHKLKSNNNKLKQK